MLDDTVRSGRQPPSPLRLQTPDSPTPAANKVAHTLTACSRCRQRKTRCDPGLPRCTPCEKSASICEYWDPIRRQNVNRSYVVWLESRVHDLEVEITRSNLNDANGSATNPGCQEQTYDDEDDDSETMVREPAKVKLQDADDTKYLGPSSGTQLTRIVMKLAKTFTSSRSIREIIPDAQAQRIRKIYQDEAVKPTSKIYPLVSDVAATDLPVRSLTDLLVRLYNLKVQSMYPALHEPTFAEDVNAVYRGHGNQYQNFITRMVIAISLQKMDSQYAGLADSYYLAALAYLDAVVAPMNLQTLQAFALIAEYSLLTPTRTAIYFIIGIAVRLTQSLGIHQERTIAVAKDGSQLDALQIDMRRRLYWCIFVMESGLSHALGRPDAMAVDRRNLDVGFFQTCSDEHITPQGITPSAPRIIKKWIAIHFFKLRLLQLEIREMLYLRKRETPTSDKDPWFTEMLAKMQAWRDVSPDNDEGIALDKVWFTARYNTMISLLYRPSPQIPTPSPEAAVLCFDSARSLIYSTEAQIRIGNVDLTWIFTQAIFMSMNSLLWSLSYSKVRKQNPRAEVEAHLENGMKSIAISATRWPGVASAHQLYTHIIQAVLRVYDTNAEVDLQPTPSDISSPHPYGSDLLGQSPMGSPARYSPQAAVFPVVEVNGHAPALSGPLSAHSPTASSTTSLGTCQPQSPSYFRPAPPPPQSNPSNIRTQESRPLSEPSSTQSRSLQHQHFHDSLPQFQAPSMASRNSNPTQNFTSGHVLPHGHETTASQYYHQSQSQPLPSLSSDGQIYASEYVDPQYWSGLANEVQGLNAMQQSELMRSLETSGVNDIETMIEASSSLFRPRRNGS